MLTILQVDESRPHAKLRRLLGSLMMQAALHARSQRRPSPTTPMPNAWNVKGPDGEWRSTVVYQTIGRRCTASTSQALNPTVDRFDATAAVEMDSYRYRQVDKIGLWTAARGCRAEPLRPSEKTTNLHWPQFSFLTEAAESARRQSERTTTRLRQSGSLSMRTRRICHIDAVRLLRRPVPRRKSEHNRFGYGSGSGAATWPANDDRESETALKWPSQCPVLLLPDAANGDARCPQTWPARL
ncbi:predicted protein [Plenodomus lingam JN3]|uniref:Predicted protein n=1 Tax=Leptosphaeria maculans (strain JN3 / isolate v23.1.3 / race Av1-4-5-6-7-8) TaxID=985895 RepID=E5R496_LEPMJ|nr:predicted protein [Plenodomus lingam JN3]CBX91864.1 predicted protein [Plenodomus lingam JN3]